MEAIKNEEYLALEDMQKFITDSLVAISHNKTIPEVKFDLTINGVQKIAFTVYKY